MRVKILKRSFAGAEFAPDVRVLKVGGQSSAGVEKLEFELPAEWQGLSVTLHVQWLDGTLPAPVLLDDEDSVAVDKTLTASPGGQWMLLALGADGYRALTKPTKYECYSTLNTDGDVEISPTQYETFVARVLEYSNTAQQAAASAKTNAETAATAATRAVNAKGQAETAARTATAGAESSENSAARAEAAAHRAELAAPETGKVVSVNGKGGAVHLTAEDVGAMPASGAAVVQSIRLEGRTLTVTMADGNEKSFTTQDTTSLPAMTGVLGTEHGGTGKETPLTAEDVGAVEAGSGVYLKALTVQGNTMTVTKGDGSTETVMLAQEYVLPAATADALGGVKVGDYLDVDEDGTLSGKTLNDKIAAAVAVKSEPRLVWNHYEETGKRWKTYDIKMPDGLDYVHVKTKYNSSTGGYGEEVDIAKGGTANHNYGNGTGIFASNTTFQTNGTLHFATETSTGGYTVEIWLTGYHYPTLADLLTQVTAVESSVTDLQVPCASCTKKRRKIDGENLCSPDPQGYQDAGRGARPSAQHRGSPAGRKRHLRSIREGRRNRRT